MITSSLTSNAQTTIEARNVSKFGKLNRATFDHVVRRIAAEIGGAH